MSDSMAATAGGETRQSMFRVWMALSAVWVAFWLLMAVLVFAIVEIRYPLADELGPVSLIVLMPPLALLALGALARWAFEMLTPAVRRPRSE